MIDVISLMVITDNLQEEEPHTNEPFYEEPLTPLSNNENQNECGGSHG